MAELPDNLREFDDTDKTRQLIYENTLGAIKNRFPIEDEEFRLELSNVRPTGAQSFTLEQQKQALMKNRNLRTPISGKWKLIHKASNQTLDERDDVVMHVPYYTERGTIIYNGNEYSIINQSRLKPGAYVRKQRTGEIETHFNVKPGTGKSFRVHLEPKTGIFRVNVGQSKIPIYTLLKTMGITDAQLQKAWGPELLETNMKKHDSRALQKMYRRFSGYAYDETLNPDQQAAYLKESLPAFQLDSDVMARTFGLKDTTGVTPETLLRATQKMLNVSRGEEDSDDRDAPQYSNVLSIEDLVQERIDKDAGHLSRSLLYKVRRDRNLQRLRRGALNPYLDDPQQGLLFGSKLALPLEETNPLHTLEQLNRITKLGQGGISSAEAITDEARDVNNGQFGFIDPIMGPEGLNIGIDTRAAYRTFKGRDQQLYGEFRDAQSQKMVYLKPEDVSDKVLAFPGEMAKPGAMAAAMVRGKIKRVPKKSVDLEVPSTAHMMAAHTNLNPMPTGVQPGRQFYGAKFWSQYLPQVKGEVPLVDSLMDDGKTTFTEHYGRRIGTLKSKIGGTVTRVTDKGITVTDENGKKHFTELVKDFPFNRLTGISYFPKVKAGDPVNVGDMLAHSNFTDSKSGAINMGINLKTAVIPARGMSYEDAYVISETAARKLSTERLYGFDRESRQGVKLDKNRYMSVFPRQFSKEQLETMDKDGTVKPGTVVNQGDPLILAVGPKLLTSADAQLGKLHKVLRNAHTDRAITWDHTFPGTVTDVAMTQRGAKVNVKSTPPVQTGDKLSSRFGLKGVVGKVIPDDQMPREPASNLPYELLLNPMGILSRVAPAQLIELSLGKLAKATGKQVRIPQNAPEGGWAAWAEKQLADAGIDEDTPLFDPKTGKNIKPVGDGYIYISAFHHLADKKLSSRGEQGSYTIDEQPAKGGETGAKRFSSMDVNATLAHGATEVIRDVMLVRGTKNEEYWKALKSGRPLPEPKTPFIYEKFLNTMKAGGINIRQQGDTLSLMPMTDADISKLSKGAISSSKMITMPRGNDAGFEPIPGGLFDVGKTGGMNGNRWTHIDLVEPLPNPVMEEPIRRMLGLKVQEMRDIVAGTATIEGVTGGRGLSKALAAIDVDEEIEKHKLKVKQLRGANRDNSIKILGYLSALKKQDMHPSKWMLNKVPVLPPIFRPIARLGDMPLKADMNDLYATLIEANKNVTALRGDLPESELAEQKLNLYDAVSAAVGLGDPIAPEGQSKRLKGAIRQVIGTSPKFGMFQSKVISKTVGGVGRGVVTPDPSLDMDSIGIPEDAAWTVYRDFLIRRMRRRGFPTLKAAEMIDQRTPAALEMLEEEMGKRPVLVDRAPTWHKFNLLAFYPHITKGKTIRVSPLITKGFTMDFDGDQANFHVPVSDKAVDQAKQKMLPSRNLFSLTDLKSIRHAPSMEMTMGLYWLTREASKKKPVTFETVKEAKEAYREGKIDVNDPIVILEER